MPAGFAKMTKGVASWGWSTVPQKHLNGRVIWYTQAKVVGGGSSINAQLYTRGNARDYDAWETEAAARAGPIATSCHISSVPRITRGSSMITTATADRSAFPIRSIPADQLRIPARAQEAGIPFNDDFNGAVQDGIGHYQLTTRNAERSSTASAYLGPVRSRRTSR
jgi:Choline dehydrogenase and related flavoproteins